MNAESVDWGQWYRRWEAMQSAYLPQREDRFDLMLWLPGFSSGADLQVLDLGCGPGSLAFRALDRYPSAHVVAVDADLRLLALGERAYPDKVGPGAGHVAFLHADLRDAGWWEPYAAFFDIVMSSTALHWLNGPHLSEVYARILRVLRPGGWLLNADHIASDDAELQRRYREILRSRQRSSLEALGGEDWDGFWSEFEAVLKAMGVVAPPDGVDWWEGSDDGLARSKHVELLRDVGYESVTVHWQYLGEALMGAIKPSVHGKLFDDLAKERYEHSD